MPSMEAPPLSCKNSRETLGWTTKEAFNENGSNVADGKLGRLIVELVDPESFSVEVFSAPAKNSYFFYGNYL